MNDYELIRRVPQFASIHHYDLSSGDRNAPAFLSSASRPNFRGCPIDRSRGLAARELERDQGGGQPRRRIAVACARCRKRKIRCTGDPGNGNGCEGCRNAGADTTQCQFHRVGSGDAVSIMGGLSSNIANHYNNSLPIVSNPHAMMPIYSASSPVYHRAYTNPSQFPTINTKSTYTPSWTSNPFADESPVDSYGLANTTYLTEQEPLNAIYTAPESSMRWSQMSQKAMSNGNGLYVGQETPATTFASHGLPYITTPTGRSTATTESMSPLNMTSLNSTLPAPLTDRQLPIPQTSRSQSTTGGDQLQSRALPTTHDILNNSVGSNGTYTKAAMPWGTEGAMADGRPSSITSSSSGEIIAPTPKPYMATITAAEPVLAYITETSSSEPSPTSTAPSMTYSATSSSESMPATSLSPGYSSIRPRGLTIDASGQSALSRQGSCPSLYNFSMDTSSKRNSMGEITSAEGTLVSGRRYAPPQTQPQHAASMDSLRRGSYDQHTSLAHRASVSSLNRAF